MKAAALEDPEWQADAALMIERLALTQGEFTAEDLRRVMRPAPVANWTGIAFTAAKRAGHIEPTGYQTSNTPSRKHGVLRTWKRRTDKGVTES